MFTSGGERFNFDKSPESVLHYANAIQNLTDVQQNAVLTAAGLSEESRNQIKSYSLQAEELEKLTYAEVERKLNLQENALVDDLRVKATDKFSMAEANAAIESKKMTKENAAALVGFRAVGNAVEDAGGKMKKASFSFATLKGELLAMVGTPMGMAMTLLTVLPLVVEGVTKIYDALTVTSEEAYQNAEEHTKAYQQIESDLDSLKNKREEVQSQITEMELAGKNGKLINNDDLNTLKAMNAELTTAINQKEKLAEVELKDADKDYALAFSKRKFENPEQFVREDAYGRVIGSVAGVSRP